eukprot:scaffold28168_cov75-Phaeocystis_antarctica.AAC.3
MPGMSPLVITHRRRGPRFARTLSLARCTSGCALFSAPGPRNTLSRRHATRAHIAGGSGTQRPGYRPMRALPATVLSSSGPARKYTAKFEPVAWSWAQMTSGFGLASEPQNAFVHKTPRALTAHAHAGVSVSRCIKSGSAANTHTVTIVRA